MNRVDAERQYESIANLMSEESGAALKDYYTALAAIRRKYKPLLDALIVFLPPTTAEPDEDYRRPVEKQSQRKTRYAGKYKSK